MVYRLENKIQHYDWGSRDALKELFGIENPESLPQAEIWMGAHDKAPSSVIVTNKKGIEKSSIINFIEQDPAGVLGKNVSKRFGGTLPFLFKVLSADRPLSIQSHPNKEQAKKGFALEEAKGISKSARERNYKDGNHKPELIYALTPFKALNGFREPGEMIRLLDGLEIDFWKEQLTAFKALPTREGLKQFYTWLMRLPGEVKKELATTAAVSAWEKKEEPAYGELKELANYYPGDIGILGAVVLNLVNLKPGEAMFLEAGQLHAYLKGTGMEIMANSDNVLRGGLTSKHVDVDELLKTLTFSAGAVERVKGRVKRAVSGCEIFYPTPAAEFSFSVLEVNGVG